MTRLHDNIVGLDASILMHPGVWEASGHVSNFTDPMVDCRQCKSRFIADQIDLNAPCPVCGNKGTFTTPRNFNLMFATHIGADIDAASTIYLRPETAQGIYTEFKNIVQSSRVKVPFGIAQVGKSFRNEITTKNFIFRSCEFEQMEMQWFCKPGTDEQWFPYWREQRMNFYINKMGIRADHLRWHQHGPDELAFYAKDAYDIQFLFPMGWQELEGVHSRTDYDLTQHQKFSGKDMSYLDPETNERYIAYVVETSAGLTRNVLMALSDAYDEEEVAEGDVRTVLHFHPAVAPVTVAVLPLVKKDGLSELALNLEHELREDFATYFDQSGAIGRRYRRQDEIGTPYCVTVDYDTLKDNTVTLRFRDSMEQVRVPIAELVPAIRKAVKEYRRG